MRYIKYFEGISLLRINRNLECQELKEFCEERLCYLIDEGFDIRVIPNGQEDKYDIFIRNYNNSNFTYQDVCDQLIPFLRRLNKEYLLRDPFSSYSRSSIDRRTSTEKFNNNIIIYTRQDNVKRGSSFDVKDILTDDKSNGDIKELYDLTLTDIKLSVIPRKWNRHIYTGSLMDIQYPNN
jgi:hypothetical protein